MINGKTIAIVIVDTLQHSLAANALYNSLTGFSFDQILIYSDIKNKWGNHEVRLIKPIKNISEYNELIIYQLSNDLFCDYALIIQYDGFIINPSLFSPIFLEFDYIGAPWHHLEKFNVGNGGFSLRSKRLVQKISKIQNIDISIPEDVLICQHLQSSGILSDFNFAPLNVAKYFSYEYPKVNHDTFGFHGVFNLPFVYRNNLDFFIEQLPAPTLINKFQYFYPNILSCSAYHAQLLEEKYNKFLLKK